MAFASLLNALLFCASIARTTASIAGIATSPLDFGIDYTKDPFPPYPPLTYPNGSNISIVNLRGTRLYGWKGYAYSKNDIAQAFDDFYTLSQQPSVYKNIDWNTPAAQQIYKYSWWPTLDWILGRTLWIEFFPVLFGACSEQLRRPVGALKWRRWDRGPRQRLW